MRKQKKSQSYETSTEGQYVASADQRVTALFFGGYSFFTGFPAFCGQAYCGQAYCGQAYCGQAHCGQETADRLIADRLIADRLIADRHLKLNI
jgi:hypothetical protein